MKSKKLLLVSLSLMSLLVACGGNDDDQKKPKLRTVSRTAVPASCLINVAGEMAPLGCLEGYFEGQVLETRTDASLLAEAVVTAGVICDNLRQSPLGHIQLVGTFQPTTPCDTTTPTVGFCSTSQQDSYDNGTNSTKHLVIRFYNLGNDDDRANAVAFCAQADGTFSDQAPQN